MKTKITSALLLLSLLLARADDITTLKGEKFLEVTIKRIEPDGIVVLKPNLIAKILFTDLSPEFREKYRYNSNKPADIPEASAAADAQRQAEAAKGQSQENILNTRVNAVLSTPMDRLGAMSPDQRRVYDRACAIAEAQLGRSRSTLGKSEASRKRSREASDKRNQFIQQLMSNPAFIRETLK
jgi:hypothetical protein